MYICYIKCCLWESDVSIAVFMTERGERVWLIAARNSTVSGQCDEPTIFISRDWRVALLRGQSTRTKLPISNFEASISPGKHPRRAGNLARSRDTGTSRDARFTRSFSYRFQQIEFFEDSRLCSSWRKVWFKLRFTSPVSIDHVEMFGGKKWSPGWIESVARSWGGRQAILHFIMGKKEREWKESSLLLKVWYIPHAF